MQRRTFLGALGAATSPMWLSSTALAAGLKPLGPVINFDFAWLKGRAHELAAAPYQAHDGELPPDVKALDYDQYQSIVFKDDHALWGDDKLRFRIKLYHLGMFFKRPVRMYEVGGGKAQQLAYDPAMFDYGKSGLKGTKQSASLGFAGFRINADLAPTNDVAAFLGASYFRAVGGERQYGISARGLAINTGMPQPEEFPDFTEFYFDKPDVDSNTVVVYALLDSPSITGAYRFAITPGDTVVMDIDAVLYPRTEIERMGIAPCTSMFQTGENDHRMGNDWRAEIHDSDGLSINTGNGEWLWRPLTNPKGLRFNAFSDNNPHGFGLLQRDRDFDHYQDDGAFYNRRPSLWVAPKNGWGAGAVTLIEIPTVDETFDNIVAFWVPEKKPQTGEELLFSYKLFWGSDAPVHAPMAQVIATRSGIGGIVGQKRKHWSQRFVIDFKGGDLQTLDSTIKVEPVISASRGTVELTSARPLGGPNSYRAMFDLVPDEKAEPITLRVYLSALGRPLSETWIYEWTPPPVDQRPLV